MPRLASAVSARSRDLVDGPARSARVAGSCAEALYLLVDPSVSESRSRVLPVMRPSALRLPVGVVVPDAPARRWPTCAQARVGDRSVVLGDWELAIVRTFTPSRVTPRRTHPWTCRLAHAVELVHRDLPILVGAGAGLTPAGDDVVCGAVLMLRALGHTQAVSWLRAETLPLLARTTAVSAELLDAAHDGFAVPAVTALVESMANPSAQVSAGQVEAVRRIGHSSGPALLDGIERIADAAGLAVPWPVSLLLKEFS